MKQAALSVDRAATIAPVDPRLYGSFIEQLGRAVYNGIYQPDHPSADRQGFRHDVLGLVRALGVPIIRYPGGNFVSGYRWEDGVGPRELRPRRLELAWGVVEPNLIGTNEFADWAKAAGSEVMMSVNLGTRGPQEAADLVEYCNHPAGTLLSDLRRKHGWEQPHGIHTWCLGNEMDGPWQICHKTAEEYGRVATEAGKMMKWVDPSIELVACGSSGYSMPTFGKWEETVLDMAFDQVDYVSLHTYYGCRDGDAQSFLSSALDMEPFIRSVASICDKVSARHNSRKKFMLSFDEWNVWYHSNAQDAEIPRWSEHPHQIEDIYDVQDAVLVGSMLITLLRNCDRVKIACLAQLVNVIAPIMTEDDGGAWCQTIYYPFLHASQYGRGEALRVAIDAPQYTCQKYGEVPAVDAVAVRDEEAGTLTVFAVNRSLEEDLTVSVDLRSFGQAALLEHIVYTGEPLAHNGPDPAGNILPGKADGTAVDKCVATAVLPRVSWNVLRFQA